MHHSYMDKLAYRDTMLSLADPRGKLAATLLYVLALSLVPPAAFGRLGLLALLLFGLIMAGDLPKLYVFKRSLLVLPFAGALALIFPFTQPGPIVGRVAGLAVTSSGLLLAATVLLKAMLAAAALLVLAATTKFSHLTAALRWYQVPSLFVDILAFLYRYLFLVVDEAERVGRARRARTPGKLRRPVRTGAAMIATLVGRSFARSERVFFAMSARGYDGTMRTLDPMPSAGKNIALWIGAGAVALALALAPMPGWLSRGTP